MENGQLDGIEQICALPVVRQPVYSLPGAAAMTLPTGLIKIRALAINARDNQYDGVALNDYGTAMTPAVTIDMIDLIRQLQADVVALRQDAERYRWIRDQKPCAFYLERNGENSVSRMTAAEWIDDTPEQFDDTPPEHIAKMKEADAIWRLQIYPDTPISSGSLSRATLDDVVDAARSILSGPKAPELRTIEVWTEGYSVTGGGSRAARLGVFQAATFDDAVEQHLQTLDAEGQSFYRQSESGEWRCWGCRLFDNEAEARKAFG